MNPRDISLRDEGGARMNVHYNSSGTLTTSHYPYVMQEDESMEKKAFVISSLGSHGMNSSNPYSGSYETDISRTLDVNCGDPRCNQGGLCVVEPKTFDVRISSEGTKNSRAHCYPTDTSRCLDTGGSNPDSNQGGICVLEGNGSRPSHQGDGYKESDVMYTLNTVEQHAVTAPVYSTSHTNYHTVATEDTASALIASDYKDPPTVAEPTDYVVRRVTPLECERLQGYEDNWTLIGTPKEKEVDDYDIEYDKDFNIINKTKIGSHKEIVYTYESNGKTKEVSDTARYKALGNSIALPFWKVLARKISAQYDRDITMASLFDGIGGFPIAFEHCGGKAIWASEIEDFPIAVTKQRFPEEDD